MTEVVGIALGTLSIIISAVENYEVAYERFTTFCRYNKEMTILKFKLETQRTIFKNQCQLLFGKVGGNLIEILGDSMHPCRNNELLGNRLRELLGASYESCISTLNLISNTLEKLSDETKGFRDILLEEKAKGRSSLSKFGLRLKLSFSKPQINNILGELRLFNEDFKTLTFQVSELTSYPLTQAAGFEIANLTTFKITQQAAKGLFHDLECEWLCSSQIEHRANMSLRLGDRFHHKSSKVSFDMAVICSQPASEPIRVVIESVLNKSHGETPLERSAITLQSSLRDKGEAKGKTVSFSLTTEASANPRATQTTHLLNQEQHLKLCEYFRNTGASNSGDCCVLEKSEPFKYFVYPKSVPASSVEDLNTASLKEVLQGGTRLQMEENSVQKLELAKLLALAVLQFHSTPWLLDSWSSSDIRVLRDGRLQDASVDVRLSSDASPRIAPTEPGTQIFPPNNSLFSLGVVLMKLFHSQPFESLQGKAIDNSGDPEFHASRNFEEACRISGNLHKLLPTTNMRYQTIVERCWWCNFGQTRKLEDAELQRAVFIQVVNELDECLKTQVRLKSLFPSYSNRQQQV